MKTKDLNVETLVLDTFDVLRGIRRRISRNDDRKSILAMIGDSELRLMNLVGMSYKQWKDEYGEEIQFNG